MRPVFKTYIVKGEGRWHLHVDTPGGVRLEYELASEGQARFFARVFEMGPRVVPPALRAVPIPRAPPRPPRTSRRARRRAARTHLPSVADRQVGA